MEAKEMSTWYEIMVESRAILDPIEPDYDPMELGYDALAWEAEPTSQYQDSRDSAEIYE